MDIYDALEKKVDKLIENYKAIQVRVTELEKENQELKNGGVTEDSLHARVDELEAERVELRSRLEKVLENLASVEI